MYSLEIRTVQELEEKLNPIINKVIDTKPITQYEYCAMMEVISELQFSLNDIITAFNFPIEKDELVTVYLEDEQKIAFYQLSKVFKTIEAIALSR